MIAIAGKGDGKAVTFDRRPGWVYIQPDGNKNKLAIAQNRTPHLPAYGDRLSVRIARLGGLSWYVVVAILPEVSDGSER